MSGLVDWTHGEAHMLDGQGVTVAEATEALADPARVILNPDPKSESGKSIRIIGYAESTARLLTVILVEHDGNTYGANGWEANATDRNRYTEERETP